MAEFDPQRAGYTPWKWSELPSSYEGRLRHFAHGIGRSMGRSAPMSIARSSSEQGWEIRAYRFVDGEDRGVSTYIDDSRLLGMSEEQCLRLGLARGLVMNSIVQGTHEIRDAKHQENQRHRPNVPRRRRRRVRRNS